MQAFTRTGAACNIHQFLFLNGFQMMFKCHKVIRRACQQKDIVDLERFMAAPCFAT